MEQATLDIVQKSYQKVQPRAERTARYFFKKLFEYDPQLQPAFANLYANTANTKEASFINMLSNAISGPEEEINSLVNPNTKFWKTMAKPTHFDYVGTAFIASLSKVLKEEFTLEVQLAWCAFYSALTNSVKNASYIQ